MSLYLWLLCHCDGNDIKEADGYKPKHNLTGTLCLFHNAGLRVKRVYPTGISADLTCLHSVFCAEFRCTRWNKKRIRSCGSWRSSSRPSRSWRRSPPSAGWPSRSAWAPAWTRPPDVTRRTSERSVHSNSRALRAGDKLAKNKGSQSSKKKQKKTHSFSSGNNWIVGNWT